MNIAIVGSRSISDYNAFERSMNVLLEEIGPIDCIVSGGAAGVDSMAERYAKSKNIPTKIFLPDWNTFGKSAGPIRNKLIVEASDIVLAFYDGSSRGTQSTIDLAKQAKKKVRIISLVEPDIY